VINFSESEVLERQMANLLKRLVNARGPGAHSFKKCPKLLFAHQLPP
jgi:hypothetical protein